MTVVLTGGGLTRQEVVRVARQGEPVAIDPSTGERMLASRRIVDQAHARGDAVYGLSTGVGVLKRVGVPDQRASSFSDRVIRHHLVALGKPAPPDVVRATMLRLANGLAEATPGVRPEVLERLVSSLNDGAAPRVRVLGSVGQSDLAPLADLAAALFGDIELAPGEGLALINNNAFSTGWAALAISDAEALLDVMEEAGALSLEALVANPAMLHPAIGDVRPYPGLQGVLRRLRLLLEGSFLWGAGAARSLQDPLTFRNLPQLLGAARDALEHADSQLTIELNASQGNPIVVQGEGVVISVGNFEVLPLAAVLDYVRDVLATILTAASERVVKLLDTPWSGLPTGLIPEAGTEEPGLAYLGIVCQALATEARLLAQPVSLEMASSAHAEGIEDRTTMAPLAVRRLAEMVDLGRQIVGRELVVAAQAVELRGLEPLGQGTAQVLSAVRRVVPFLVAGATVPPDLDPLIELIESDWPVPEGR